MYPELATPSAPPASPTLSPLPPPYAELYSMYSSVGAAIIPPVTRSNSENTAVSATRNAQIFSAFRQNKNPVNHPITDDDNDDDDAGYNYYGGSRDNFALPILAFIFIPTIATICIFAGFTLLYPLGAIVDEKSKNTNFTLLFGTVGSMVGLYQTDAIKTVMDATVAKVGWNWDNMSNTTHEFLSFNVAITLSIMAGTLAQGLVEGAIAAKDKHSGNKMRIS